jgi:hypothetical protein
MKRITLPLLLLCLLLSVSAASGQAGEDNKGAKAGPNGGAAQTKASAKGAAAGLQNGANAAESAPALKDLQERVATLEGKVTAAETKAEGPKERLDNLPTAAAAQADPYERWGVIGGVAASLLGLGVLSVFSLKLRKQTFRLSQKSLRKSLMATRKQAGRLKDDRAKGRSEDAVSYSDLIKDIKAILAEQKEEILTKIVALEARVEELSKRLAEPPTPPTPEPTPPAADGDGRAKVLLSIGHPATVDEYLTRSREAQLTLLPVKSDVSVFNNLAQDEDNRFWLARDDGSREGVLFPKASRLGSDDEFYTFYGKYYECAEPSAGDVLIVSPGIVEEDEQHGGWRVKTKGVLKVE